MPQDLQLRATLRRWMKKVLDDHDWSAAEWARRAGTSATNITRFLSHEDAPFPNVQTLYALETAANSTWRDVAAPATTVPVVPKEILVEHVKSKKTAISLHQKLRGLSLPQIHASGEGAGRQFVVVLESPSMNAAGYLPGDHLICANLDDRPPRDSDIVACIVDGDVCAMRVAGTILMPQSADLRIRPVPIDDAYIIGVVVEAIRRVR